MNPIFPIAYFTFIQSKESKFPDLEAKAKRNDVNNKNEIFNTNQSKEGQPEFKRSKRSSSVSNDIDIDLSSAPKIQVTITSYYRQQTKK